MLKKRLSAVVTVQNDLAVQSFEYKKYLPIGDPCIVVENLNRWGADEIIILDINRSRFDLGPNINLLRKLSSSKLSTPLIYGGGIGCYKQAVLAIKQGADRIIVDSLVHHDLKAISDISKTLGAQAIIPSMPVKNSPKAGLLLYDYQNRTYSDRDPIELITEMTPFCSEFLIIDHVSEGYTGRFNREILNAIKVEQKLIVYGGLPLCKNLRSIFQHKSISSVALGNPLYYKEHQIQRVREQNESVSLRTPNYLNN